MWYGGPQFLCGSVYYNLKVESDVAEFAVRSLVFPLDEAIDYFPEDYTNWVDVGSGCVSVPIKYCRVTICEGASHFFKRVEILFYIETRKPEIA